MAAKSRVTVDDQKSFSQFISFSGVQSAANAFLQVSIPTNVTPQQEQVLVLSEVVVAVDTVISVNQFNYKIDYSLTRATKLAVPTFADTDVLAKGSLVAAGGGAFTAGFVGQFEQPLNMPWVGKEIVASPSVFLQFQTTNMVGVLSISGRIYFDVVSMPKDQILEVLYG
jgi:hypothetical protein